jgi:hypothetical protein
MNVGKAIYYKLVNNATVAGIVGTRVYQTRLPQSASYPAVMIQKVSDTPYSTDSGNNMFNARMQVNSYHTDHASAHALAVAVMTAIDFIQQEYINGVNVVQISFLNETDLSEDFAGFEGLFHVAQDYFVVYQKMDS